MNMNKLILIGRLACEPESFPFPGGSGTLTKFGLEVTNRYKNPCTGKVQEMPISVDVEFFDKNLAAQVANYSTGQVLLVEGWLELDLGSPKRMFVVPDSVQPMGQAQLSGNTMSRTNRTPRRTPVLAGAGTGDEHDEEGIPW